MIRPAGSAKLLRSMNESAALGHLLDRGRLTRGELRELTGLSKPTTSDVLRRLTGAGLAMVTGHTSGGPGPNAAIYTANPDAAYAAAVSLRDTGTSGQPALALAIVDLTGAVRARAEVCAPAEVPALVEALAVECRAAGLSTEDIRYVQLGVPGAYDPGTDRIHHVHVPGLDRAGLVGELRAALRTHVGVENDVNLAAVAERTRGAAADADSFALLWLGDGLGLAIDLGGSLLRGARGGAGEIAYMPTGLGRQPNLHDIAGGQAVLALAREHGVVADTPGEAVARADAALLAALADRIAIGLLAVVAVLDPPLVVLAGEVGRSGGAALCDAVRTAMRGAAPLETEVAPTGLTEDPVLLGALDAALAEIRAGLLNSL